MPKFLYAKGLTEAQQSNEINGSTLANAIIEPPLKPKGFFGRWLAFRALRWRCNAPSQRPWTSG